MPDSFGVYDGMRLVEYLDFFGAAYKIPRKKRRSIIDDVLQLTDLASKADDFVSTFSRGMKQRCCLAKTLLHDPKVLLLDEPASGLDPRARIEMRELLKTLRKMGKTVVISSHILSELGDMCNRIGILEHGVLIKQGKYPDILDEIRQTRLARLKTFLLETTLPIGQISVQCGFQTEMHAKRVFKQYTRQTMRQFRRTLGP